MSKIIDLLKSNDWPEAIKESLISKDIEDKIERATSILDYTGFDILGKKVLDFGCGEGHLATIAAEIAQSVGYDPSIDSKNDYLTCDFNKVKSYGPYDFIILYDVLDHCRHPIEALNQVKQVCHLNTKIFVRCHSWMSRHGSHIYKELNKAWAHLFLTEEELIKLNIKIPFVQKYYFPIKVQQNWFLKAGFKINNSEVIRCPVDQFFKKIIQMRQIDNFGNKLPEWQMSQVYNDYFLGIK